MLEFGIKYSIDDKIQVKSESKEILEINKQKHIVIQFSIIMTKNNQFDIKPLKILLQQEDN